MNRPPSTPQHDPVPQRNTSGPCRAAVKRCQSPPLPRRRRVSRQPLHLDDISHRFLPEFPPLADRLFSIAGSREINALIRHGTPPKVCSNVEGVRNVGGDAR